MRTVSLIRLHRAILLLLFVACDSFEPEREGQITFETNEYYVLPGSSIIIDLKSVVKQSFTTVTLSVAQDPLRGTLTQLDPFLLKYTPHADFLEGADQFVISAILDNGDEIKAEDVTIFMKDKISEFPCGMYPIEDYARVIPNEVAIVHPLTNDRTCDVSVPLNVFIHLEPKFGTAVVAGDSIVYTANSSFVESDELVYRLSTADGDVSYGLVSVNKMRIETFGIPPGINDIFFVDDLTGFMAGGNLIYKTVDGGKRWISLDYPGMRESSFFYFKDLFFLDEKNGFAAFGGGWMRTRNGGESWEMPPGQIVAIDDMFFGPPANSIFFTSPLNGFMSIALFDLLEVNVGQAVLKTIDGGEMWEVVLLLPSLGEANIRFMNEDIGYVFQPEEIFSTTDGGRTWTSFVTNNYITSMAVAGENVLSASFNATLSLTTPGTIVRSENGSPFTVVSNYPYSILTQAFSPSGDLGLAVGVSETNASADPKSQLITISRSTDKGKTWTDLPVVVHGFPWEVAVPSENVAYILCFDKIIKCTH